MKLFEIDLFDNEKIILKVRQHWLLLLWPTWKWLFFSAIGFVGFQYFNLFDQGLIGVLLYLCWVMFFFNFWIHDFLQWYLNIYFVTNQRIINVTHQGIFQRQTSEASITYIQDVTFKTLGILSLLLNYGDVIIQTSGPKPFIHFHYVPNPRKIHNTIIKLMSRYHYGESDQQNKKLFF